jgi:hypothetical protein
VQKASFPETLTHQKQSPVGNRRHPAKCSCFFSGTIPGPVHSSEASALLPALFFGDGLTLRNVSEAPTGQERKEPRQPVTGATPILLGWIDCGKIWFEYLSPARVS